MTAAQIIRQDRPCKKCGANDRNPKGKCNACNRARASAWYAANQDRGKSNGAAYRAANPDKHKATVAAYVLADPSRKRASDAAWHAANADKERLRKAAWYMENPNAARTHAANRRCRKLSGSGSLSAGLAAKLFRLQKGRCACCGASLKGGYHMDHIVALSKGGANIDGNMQLLTQKCNLQKCARDPIEFMQSRGYLL